MFRIPYLIFSLSSILFGIAFSASAPLAQNVYGHNVTYTGLYANEVEGFVGVRFALDTSGESRFKPPVSFNPTSDSVIEATTPGPSCPQQLSSGSYFDFSLSDVTQISEDCLRLNVWRPNGTKAGDKLPVLAYIYGGSLTGGSKDDGIQQPGGLILQSIANGYPVMAVEMNYRLGGVYTSCS